MRVLILEDEPTVAAHLVRLLHACDPSVEIHGIADNVQAAAHLLPGMRAPDLILADLHPGDTELLRFLEATEIASPVVFVVEQDEMLVKACEQNGVDHLRKPVEHERLARILVKYGRLQGHFGAQLWSLVKTLRALDEEARRRVVTRDGPVLTDDAIAWIASGQRGTVVVDRAGSRWLCDDGLRALQARLDPARFFRVNRQHLVQRDAVVGRKFAAEGRIAVELQPRARRDLLVSRERAAAFLDWLAR